MSEISDKASVTVLLADFANADAVGKLNVIGGNWTITGLQPSGLTAPQSVVVMIDVPSTLAGQSFALAVVLADDTNNPVQLPGQPGTMRIQQLVQVQSPVLPGVQVPPDIPCKVQMCFGFANGIPLEGGRSYRWLVEIDTNSRPEWAATFFVAGAPPAPVIG